jgi:hypothetical protein
MTPYEAVGEHAAAEELPQLLFDVTRERSLVRLMCVCEERLEVLSDHLVEDGLGRAAGTIRGGEDGHGAPRSGAGAMPGVERVIS